MTLADRIRELGSLLAAAYLRIAVARPATNEAQCDHAVNARESEAQ